MPRQSIVLLAVASATLAGCARTHVQRNAFTWSGTVPAGGWLRLRNVTGRITVEPSPDPAVHVAAAMRWRGSRGGVRFARNTAGGDVTICTVYSDDAACSPERYDARARRGWSLFGLGGSSVEVDYVVNVPAGVRVDVRTVTGGIRVDSVAAPVIAHTVTGSVRVFTRAGPIDASTVNGSVRARVDSLAGPGDVKLASVNGSVTAELPPTFDAHIEMETVNGRCTTDYPVTVTGTVNPRHLRATLGAGGRQVTMRTVNGSVTLRRGG